MIGEGGEDDFDYLMFGEGEHNFDYSKFGEGT